MKLPGRLWMLLALFLVALAQPVCAWQCAFPVAPVAHSSAAAVARERSDSMSCCRKTKATPAAVSTTGHRDSGSPPQQHSCCAAHADAFAEAVAAFQLSSSPSATDFSFAVAALPSPVRVSAPLLVDLRRPRDGTRLIFSPPFFAASFHRRGPPTIL